MKGFSWKRFLVLFRGDYLQGEATPLCSTDGKSWSDAGQKIALKFGSWIDRGLAEISV